MTAIADSKPTDKQSENASSVEASIFFVLGDRAEDDPPNITNRAIVLYGEALVQPGDLPVQARRYDEGSKLRRLRWCGRAEDFASQLQQPFWEHPDGKVRFSFGLSRRPPLIALPTGSLSAAWNDGRFLPPGATGSAIEAFVCTDKGGIASALVDACGGEGAATDALDRLKAVVLRDLRGRDVGMFGDVYLAERRRDRSDPVHWTALTGEHQLAKRLLVEIDEASVPDAITVNIRVYGADLVPVCDTVFHWRRGTSTSRTLDINQDIGGAWLRAWDAGGNLIAEQAHGLLREISTGVMFQTGTDYLEDKLTHKTRRAVQGGAANPRTLARVAAVSRGSTIHTRVEAPDEAPWSSVRRSAGAVVHRHIRATFDEDAFFPAGADGRAMAILAFADKLSGSQGATIVDPYLDVEGGAALLARIRTRDIPITIVTWLGSVDAPPAIALRDWLGQAANERVLSSRLRVLQLPGKSQTFHDRYVSVRYPADIAVYNLSNSFSGLAKDYPLVVSRLSDGTAWAVREEIEEIVSRAQAEGTQLWPLAKQPTSDQTSSSSIAASSSLFPNWKVLLRLVTSALGDSDEAWIDAACDFGLMHRHASGVDWQVQGVHEELLRRHLREALVRGPAQLGVVLQLMGEVRARGLTFDPIDVAAEVASSIGAELAVPALCEHLRQTLTEPATSRDRNFVNECVRTDFSVQSIESAFWAWNNAVPQLMDWPRRWGRDFAFVVLGHLDPATAVRLTEQLPDMTLVAVACGTFRDRVGDVLPVANAMLSSSSPFLRAFGAQAGAVSWTRAHHANHLPAPDQVQKTVANLRTIGHPSIDLLQYLVLWVRDAAPERRSEAVGELLAELTRPDTTDASQQDALWNCLIYAPLAVSELMERSKATPSDASLRLCRSLLAAMPRWLPVSESERPKRPFHKSDLPMCQAFASAARRIAEDTHGNTAQVLKTAMSVEAHEKLIVPASPLMPRPGRLPAVNVLGWIALCASLSAATPGEVAQARGQARTVLDKWRNDFDPDLRAILEEWSTDSSSKASESETADGLKG